MAPALLIVDDHALFAHGMALLVRQNLAVEVLVRPDVESALQAVADTPSLRAVLLDLELPGLSGLEGVGRLLQARAGLAVVVCSSHAAEAVRQAALARGARAFVSKAESPELLCAAVRRVLGGDGDAVTSGGNGLAEAARPGPQDALTARQRDVLWLLAEGKSNKVIARQLGMSENTVRNHVAAILARLAVDNRLEAATAARRLGLLQAPGGARPA